MAKHIIHKHSNVVTQGNPKLPTTSDIEYGELAVNYADGHETISIKNSNNDIITFSSDEAMQEAMNEQSLVIAEGMSTLDKKIDDTGWAVLEEVSRVVEKVKYDNYYHDNSKALLSTDINGNQKGIIVSPATIVSDGISVVNEGGELYLQKTDGYYPVSHPDISTQPSMLPQRFGNLKMYEIASRVSDKGSGIYQLLDIPSNVMIASADAFNGTMFASVNCVKANGVWKAISPAFTPDWCIVKYVGSGNDYYGYGGTYNTYSGGGKEIGYCDIAYYDVNGQDILITTGEDFFSTKAGDNNYVPIGLVVIPASHMPDGKLRIMSINNMDTSNPEYGTNDSNVTILWGNRKLISTLNNFNMVVIDDNGTIGLTEAGYLPDSNGPYISSPDCPSPYLADGSKNPVYFYNTTVDGIDFSVNALSDIDGEANTDKIVAMATSQPNWQTDQTITNSSDDGYFPAACCCRRYHTAGTSAGDWYLPSMGELGYVGVHKLEIEKTLMSLNVIGADWEHVGRLLYSSTQMNYRTCRTLFTNSAYANVSYKDYAGVAYAFMKLADHSS